MKTISFKTGSTQFIKR